MIQRRVAVVFLVDPSGRILMQHRAPTAKVSPNQWALPGGRIEPGETAEQAAVREVKEETGITIDTVEHFWSGTRPSVFVSDGGEVEMNVFSAPTDARQEDVVLGEGQAMIFLDPAEARARDLGVTARIVLPMFLDSARYRTLARRNR